MGKKAINQMQGLTKNSAYMEMKAEKQARRQELRRLYTKDQRGLIEELAAVGIRVNSVWDLVSSENNYTSGLPVLVKHLTIKHHPKILAGIVRSLAVPEFSNDEELWNTLLFLYRNTDSDSHIEVPVERGVQQAIAVALETLATKGRESSLAELIGACPNGDGIHWVSNALSKLE